MSMNTLPTVRGLRRSPDQFSLLLNLVHWSKAWRFRPRITAKPRINVAICFTRDHIAAPRCPKQHTNHNEGPTENDSNGQKKRQHHARDHPQVRWRGRWRRCSARARCTARWASVPHLHIIQVCSDVTACVEIADGVDGADVATTPHVLAGQILPRDAVNPVSERAVGLPGGIPDDVHLCTEPLARPIMRGIRIATRDVVTHPKSEKGALEK